MLEIRTLGQFEVQVAGEPVEISSRPAQSLLAYLVLNAGTAQRREKLAGLFWPDASESNARSNLRHALWRIRKALESTTTSAQDYLIADDLTVAFNPASEYWLDVTALERVSGEDASIENLAEAVGLYQGELLPGFYDEWVPLERERLQAVFERKMGQLLDRLVEAGHWRGVLAWGERWIALGGTPELAYRALMVAHAMLGDRPKVAAVYHRCKEALHRELGVEPSQETQDLYARLTSDAAPPFVPARDLSLQAIRLDETAPAPGDPPFKGLQYFDEADADLFFGRESLTARLVARIAPFSYQGEGRGGGHFLAVVGASGSGKSSLVRAGLVPALRRGGPLADGRAPSEGGHTRPIHIMTPTAHPLQALASNLTCDSRSVTTTTTLIHDLTHDPHSLHHYVCRRLGRSTEAHNNKSESHNLVLIVDQFEELFTLCRDEAQRRAFIDNLLTAAGLCAPSPDQSHDKNQVEPSQSSNLTTLQPSTIIIIALRADFYAHCAQYEHLRQAMAAHQEYIGPMTPEELRRAVEGPAQRGNWSFEPGLVDLLLGDVGDEPGALPLLSHALLETWHRRRGHVLTLSGYTEAGRVGGAIACTAERVLEELGPRGQIIARNIFLRLTELGEGTQDTRRRVGIAELIPYPEEKSAVEGVLKTLVDARLVTTYQDAVEVAHEALIREWPTLRGWLNANREALQIHRHLTEAAQSWEKMDRDPGELYRGARLAQAGEWAGAHVDDMNALEREFLKTSQVFARRREAEREAQQQRELEAARKLAQAEARRADEQARARRRLRWLAAGLAVFLVITLGVAWFAFNQRNVAQENFVTAERIRLAAQAQIALDNGEGGDLPALLALRSLRHGYSPEADAALLSALSRGFTRQRYLGHTDDIFLVSTSPDGRFVLTASADRTARLWDAQTGREIRQFIGHVAAVNSAIFSPAGRYVLTGSHDNTARLWDAQTGQELRRFTGHSGGVWGIDFTPDGQYALTTDGRAARLWNVETGAKEREFIGHTGRVWWADISPDGRYLATAGNDNTARLWDMETGQEIRQFLGHNNWVGGVRFSPDGQYLLTTSADRTARLWDIHTGLEIRRFVGHTDDLFDGAFSPDGRYVLTGSYDKTARLWDIATSREVHQFLGHTGFVGPVVFTADGQLVLTGSGDRTARLWDVWPEIEPRTVVSFSGGHAIDLYAISISPDTQYVLSGSTDGTVRVWDVQTGQALGAIEFEAITINAQAMSGDNSTVLTGDGEGIARLGDAQTGQIVNELAGHIGPIWDVAFSPDDTTVLTGGEDGTARLWDTQSGQELLQFVGHDGPVRAVAFSPDAGYILTGGEDHTARMWDAHTGQETRRFVGHTAAVLDMAFSADGRLVVTGGDDDTARLWDAETGQEMQQLVGHTDQVSRVAFSPDGRHALTGSADQTARLWDVETGAIVRELAGHASPLLYVGFSEDGRHVLTGDAQSVYVWRATLEDVIAFTCAQLSRDLTDEERVLYNIGDDAPTCPEFADRVAAVEPTWTPVSPDAVPVATLSLGPLAETTPEVIEMNFVTDVASIQMGIPVQDVFIDAGDRQVVRPQDLVAETLAQPVFASAVEVEPDFLEEPFDAGPYPKGEPLGLTLGEFLGATGHGTYTLHGNRATLDLAFDKLIPNGVYTVWCVEIRFPPSTEMIELPCGPLDGSQNDLSVDENGHAEFTLEMDAFPPSTQETMYEVAVAYHSDGQTHGTSVGEHGLNAHSQMFFDFLPPADE